MNSRADVSAILIAGPTASGKSAIALDLAETVDGMVINVDAMQVYRELRVLTARPSLSDEQRAPHRLYGVLGAEVACSAGQWLEFAKAALDEARRTHKMPIFVGGTGLYFKALTDGIAPVPPIPTYVREQARSLYDELGAADFWRELEKLDPEGAAGVPPTDRQRLIRAFEVVTATGTPLGDWHQLPTSPTLLGRALRYVLCPDRASLYARTDARFDHMLENGAVDEVRALLGRGLSSELPAMKALGVRELADFLAGDVNLETAASQAKMATRRYAKRQITWFKNQMIAWEGINAQEMENLGQRIFTNICNTSLTLT